jgi:DnaJ-class molecular chaperone
MSANPYETLGVSPTATDAEIRTAYRKFAKEFHPDLNPGDKAAEETFKRVSTAYSIIGKPEKRALYDKGEIDDSGQERPKQPFYRDRAESEGHYRYHSSAGYDDFAEFSDLFRGRGRPSGEGGFSLRGADRLYRLDVDFLDAVAGAKTHIALPDGGNLELDVPAGVADGQVLRLKGKGGAPIGSAPQGDALIEIGVRPHPFFEREGDDIKLKVPVSLDEAVLGGSVEIPTISGRVALTVPKGTSSGRTMRLKGRGIANARTKAKGDQLVEIQIVMPQTIDADLETAIRQWQAKHPQKPVRNF